MGAIGTGMMGTEEEIKRANVFAIFAIIFVVAGIVFFILHKDKG